MTTEEMKARHDELLAENNRKQKEIRKLGVGIDEGSVAAARNAFMLNWLVENLLLPDARLALEIAWQNFLANELDQTKEKAKDVVAEHERSKLLAGTPRGRSNAQSTLWRPGS